MLACAATPDKALATGAAIAQGSEHQDWDLQRISEVSPMVPAQCNASCHQTSPVSL